MVFNPKTFSNFELQILNFKMSRFLRSFRSLEHCELLVLKKECPKQFGNNDRDILLGTKSIKVFPG